jgi:hypothetical protein
MTHTSVRKYGLSVPMAKPLRQSRLADAEKLFRDLWSIRSRGLGPEHPDTLDAEYNLAVVLVGEGRVAEA